MYIVGIDEAGRWPWAGPVVACSLCFRIKNPPSLAFLSEINDSKKLSSKKREALFDQLIQKSLGSDPEVYFWVGVVDNYVIDEINISQANKEAMRRSLLELSRKIDIKHISKILVDGKDNYEFEGFQKPQYIIGWDGKIVEIWAASIIAKVFRDRLLKVYGTLYPQIWFEKHMWYGTQTHREHLASKKDVTGIHRTSYKPVKKILF